MNTDSNKYSLRLKVSDLHTEKKVKDIIDPLILSEEQIKKIKHVFESEMALGLSKAPEKVSCLQMENTYIYELPDGTEEGEFLALDLGGTNFRVIFLCLQPPKPADYVVKYYTVPETLRTGKGDDLFDFLATCIHDFMKNHNLLRKDLPLGFCFSFPVKQKAIDVGILVPWVADYFCPDYVGKDVARMLTDALTRHGDMNVHVVAVVNDTTGTLMKGAYLDRKCAIGFVLGTGSNACYLEKADRIEKWENKPAFIDGVIVDTEMSFFGDNGTLDFIKTEFDRALDEQSSTVGCIIFEKFVGGKFIGEIIRQAILKLVSAGLLFDGKLSPEFSKNYSFTAKDISAIERDSSELIASRDILRNLGVDPISDDDVEIVKYLCSVVSIRTAVLVSICLASLLERMNKPEVTIAVDGSLYKNHPKIHELMIQFISQISGGKKFQLLLVEDGSGKGAAVVAAVATRLKGKISKSSDNLNSLTNSS